MKLMNTMKFAMIALLGAGLIACSPDDDGGGPDTPEPTGTMSGDLTIVGQDTESNPWNATSVTATYDTLYGDLIIRALDGSGNGIKLHLNDSAVGTYILGGMTSSYSEFLSTSNALPYTTKQNDADPTQFPVTIESNNGNTLSGSIQQIVWYEINAGFNDDVIKVALEDVVFANVPITYINLSNDATNSMSASLDGEAYTTQTMLVTKDASGFTLVGFNNNKTLTLHLADTLTEGSSYELEGWGETFSAEYTDAVSFLFATSGQVTITDLDRFNGTMSGTFEFDAGEELSVTDGAFSIEYE